MSEGAQRAMQHYEGELARFLDRANHYKEKNDNKKCLENLILALDAFYEYCSRAGETIDAKVAIGTNQGEYIYASTLFQLYIIVNRIAVFYKDVEYAFLNQQIKKIFDQVSQYEAVFDSDALNQLERIKKYVDSAKPVLNQYKDELKDFRPIKHETDEQFKTIRKTLRKISKTSACPITLGEDGGCFIATAAYGTSVHPDLDSFRDFRDTKLLPHPAGSKLVQLYYRVGPKLSELVIRNPTLQRHLQRKLVHLATWLRKNHITSL